VWLNIQAPTFRETPSQKLQTMLAAVLGIGVWIFSGAWCLELEDVKISEMRV
jgi:hypothetical protein